LKEWEIGVRESWSDGSLREWSNGVVEKRIGVMK